MHYWGVMCLCVIACGNDGTAGDAAPSDDEVTGGDRIAAYVRNDGYAKLVIEVDYVAGSEPGAQIRSDIETRFAAYLDKPQGIEIVLDNTLAAGGSSKRWTNDEIFALAEANYDLEVDPGTIKMHVLFVDGRSDRDDQSGSILGFAWSQRNIVIFKDTVNSTCGGNNVPPALRDTVCRQAEVAICAHEMGHVIGLVDNGLAMEVDHKDPDHGAHDINDDCLMYYAYQGADLVDAIVSDLLGGGDGTIGFDQACKNDIQALQKGN